MVTSWGLGRNNYPRNQMTFVPEASAEASAEALNSGTAGL
jgi:hypothetical protein